MNWLVTWMVITWSLGACPSPPIYDVYRGEIQQMVTTLQACYDTTEKPMQKYFSTYKEALEFVKNGKDQCEYGNVGYWNGNKNDDCDLKDFEIIDINDKHK